MARGLFFYTGYKYNKKSIITGSKYLCRSFRYKNINHKYNRGPVIIGSKYL